MKIGYARVSTQDQNLSLQIDALKAAGCERIYQEKVSGVKAERPELTKLLEHVRDGDAIVVWKLDRLGRKLTALLDLVEELKQRNVGLISLNDPIDTTSAHGRMLFQIFGCLAEYERGMIRERTQAGLASARRRGQRLGRPEGLTEVAEMKSHIAASLYQEGKYSVQEIASQISISKSTLYSYLRHRGVVVNSFTSSRMHSNNERR